MKYFEYLLIISAALLFAGCGTIPNGVVDDGPLVSVPLKNKQNFTADRGINYMITSLVMKCRVIADAGKDRPKVINDFMFYNKNVDYLQMKVWRKLIKMNMIDAKSQISESPEYRLHSEIVPIDRISEKGKCYTWKMYFERIRDNKKIWTEQVVFVK